MNHIEKQNFLVELEGKAKSLKSRRFFKTSNYNKAHHLLEVKSALQSLDAGNQEGLDGIVTKINAARENASVFHFGKVGKLFAFFNTFNIGKRTQTKSDRLLDRIMAHNYTPLNKKQK